MTEAEAESLVIYLKACFPDWKPNDLARDIWVRELGAYDAECGKLIVERIGHAPIREIPSMGMIVSAIKDEHDARRQIDATQKRLTAMRVGFDDDAADRGAAFLKDILDLMETKDSELKATIWQRIDMAAAHGRK